MTDSAPPRSHRDDPRWQAHQAAYVADYPDLTPAAVMRIRIEAAHGMHLVEVEYLGDGRKSKLARGSQASLQERGAQAMTATLPEPSITTDTRAALPFRAGPVAEAVADRIVTLVDTGRAYEAEVLARWMAPQPVGEQTHG